MVADQKFLISATPIIMAGAKTTHVKMDFRVSISIFGKRLPIAWKAALFGANMVTDSMVSTALTKPALMRAPAAAVRFAATAVVETFIGRVSTESMTWIIPPSKAMS